MKCFYHVDADGKCAAFWVDYFTKDKYHQKEYLPINYGMDFPIETIQKDEAIYIVDFSIELEMMRRLLEITENVVWIDHHISAIKKYEGFEKEIKGLRVDGIAGCMLTWYYMCAMKQGWDINSEDMEKKLQDAPYFTKLIADYDVWKFEYEYDAKGLHMTLNAYDLEPQDYRWNWLMKPDTLNHWIEIGNYMMVYRSSFYRSYCEAYGFESTFEGLRAFVLNTGLGNSDCFDSIDDGTYDIFVCAAYNGKGWNYSLRAANDNVDVSVIAQKYGGGGHKGAAGFRSEDFVFKN